MRTLVIIGMLLVAVMLTGCGHYLTTAECLTIHDMAGTSYDNFTRMDADPNVPLYAKTMQGGQALAWTNLDASVNNKGSVDANSFKPKTSK